jgi:putative nucleotidyltransferase with HDIG domain
MENLDKKQVIDTFSSYTADYNASDPKIKLKIDHTYRVAALSQQIAESLRCDAAMENEIDADLAWLTGMLHDIGRFEQIRRYQTFSDADSVDHAILGTDLLFRDHLLDRFGSFTTETRHFLEISIRNHSRYRLEEGLTPAEETYCKILRDADKIDIFRVNWDTPLEDIYNVTTEALEQAEVSDAVKACFLERHAVLRSLKQTPIDHLVGHICLLFELEYPISMQLARKQGYVQKLLSFTSKNPNTRQWFDYMRQHLWQE